ncbi:MAG: helix-turn-helix transcriptional regulator [Sulfitobacter sp.]
MWTPYASHSAIQKVIDYANERGPAITLPEVASHVGMSERTLRRHMKVELGHSWREFIRELRMNKAMKLLRDRQQSITQTAFEVGFSSSSAFSSAFLEYVGKTPTAYAKSF